MFSHSDIAKVVDESAIVNRVKLVGNEDGDTMVQTYLCSTVSEGD